MTHLSETQEFGLQWEKWALAQLEARGYSGKLRPRFDDRYDIELDCGLEIEVKAGRPRPHCNGKGSTKFRYQFGTYRGLPKQHNYVYILIAVDRNGNPYPYIVPSVELAQRQCSIPAVTSHPTQYSGWLSPYLERWEVIENVRTIRMQDNPLQPALF